MWLEAAENNQLSGVCLLDQSAAYDLLCHVILKKKLSLYNFKDSSIDWLMSYLGDRTQMVQVESRRSSPLGCGDTAVPQGSVLGGLLHVINSNGVAYVDDESVSASHPEVLRDLI